MPRNGLRALIGVGFCLALGATAAFAQQGQTVRVRGTIEEASGNTLAIKTREGNAVTVKLADNLTVRAMVKASLADVKPGTYIGSAAMPQPDGSQKALEIHIFPEALRGTGDGHRPFDLRPQSTMTNGNVEAAVASVDGQVLTVRYKDGEKRIIVGPDTPIVMYVSGERSELKAGAKIIIVAATREPDGTLSTAQIGVGRDGLTPPM
jgi:hypothetical protein